MDTNSLQTVNLIGKPNRAKKTDFPPRSCSRKVYQKYESSSGWDVNTFHSGPNLLVKVVVALEVWVALLALVAEQAEADLYLMVELVLLG